MHRFGAKTINFLLLTVGIIDSLLIGLYGVQWNLYTGSSLLEAVGFSVVFTGSAIVFFEFAIVEFLEHKPRFGAFLLFMWLIIAAYSMQQTVAGQYVSVMKEADGYAKENAAGLNAKGAGDALEAEVVRLEASKKANEKRIADIDTLLAKVVDPAEAAKYRTTLDGYKLERSRLQTANQAIESRLQKIIDQKIQVASTVTADILQAGKRDVFRFYADILKIERTDLIQFWLAVFKGIALDLINILCFMFVLIRSKQNAARTDRPASIPAKVDSTDAGILPKAGNVAPGDTQPVQQKDAVHRIAAYLYHAGGTSKNGTFISRSKAHDELGVSGDDYDRITQQGLLHGIFRRSGNKTYHVAGYSEEEFIKEVS